MRIYTVSDLDNQSNYNKINEDLLFKQIEELEEKKEYYKAAYLLITYVNITMNKSNKIRLEAARNVVKIAKEKCYSETLSDETILLSRQAKAGIQNWQNYCLN